MNEAETGAEHIDQAHAAGWGGGPAVYFCRDWLWALPASPKKSKL